MSDRTSPPRSPDGLGERLRGWSLLNNNEEPVHALLREAADRLSTLTEQVEQAWALGAGAARQDGARIAAEHVVLTRANEALRSENARLTEQVRGAEERLREQAHYWKRVLAHGDDGDSVMACFEVIAAEAEAALVLAENAARASIYDEGAGRK